MQYDETQKCSHGATNPRRVWKEDIRAAKELCYPKTVVELLKNEPSASKRQRILCDARQGKYDKRIVKKKKESEKIPGLIF